VFISGSKRSSGNKLEALLRDENKMSNNIRRVSQFLR
jgi:hypothetical protein